MTALGRARWSVAAASLLAVASMLAYRGGTGLDRSTSRYSLTNNFLSDLGMTVAWNGQPNRVGSALFVLSLAILVIGFGGALAAFVGRYGDSPRSRPFALAAAAIGIGVFAAFIGVAVTPENNLMNLHVMFTLLAFRLFPFAALALVLASGLSSGETRRATALWAGLAGALFTYAAILSWGPSVGTSRGLQVQVIAQKAITVASLALLILLTFTTPSSAHHDRTPPHP